MNPLKNISRYWLLPAILIILVLILDTATLLNLFEPTTKIRNLILIIAIIALIPLMQKFHQNISVYDKVKLLFWSVLSILVINFLYRGQDSLYRSIQSFLAHTVIAWLTIIGILLAITAIRDLILVHRKKSTSRNFYLLLTTIIIFGLFARQDFPGFNLNLTAPGTSISIIPKWISTLSVIFSIFMVYLIVLNSFRTQWVKVLNKRQKIKTFFLGAIIFGLLIVALFVMTDSSGKKLTALYQYSSAIGNFTWSCLLFIFVYLFFSIIVVLLHLPTAGVYDRKVKEISSLHQLSSIILGVFDIEQLSQIILKRTIEVTGANYGWLILKRPSSNKYDLVGQKNVPSRLLNYLSTNTSNELTDWIISNKEALTIDQISKYKLTAQLDYWRRISGSLLGIPLISGERVIGLLFAVKNVEYGFLPDDKVLMTAFANNATVAIENARLVQKSLEKEKYEQELKIAHEAQMKLLPRKMPQFDLLDIDAACLTANEVGGDYYDFFQFDPSKLGVVIGDVSGKGPEAAFYMAEVKGILESLTNIYDSPKDLLIHANKILYKTFDRKTFFSAIYGIFDIKKKTFTYCRAGHCPLLYWNQNEEDIFLIEPAGLALGLDPGKKFEATLEEQKIDLKGGDIFIFYTDGVNEARNNRQEEFEEQRLCDVVVQNFVRDSRELKGEILKHIDHFVGAQSRHDDLTMVVIKIK